MNTLHRFVIYSSAVGVLMLFAVYAQTVAAQTDELDELALLYGDEETVSIATGASKPLRLAPSVASVITAEDIQAMGARDLNDVLETVPGLHVSLSVRYSSLYSLRGIHTRFNPQVLMLVNGYPISELFSGGRISSLRLPVHNIKRVEIIRGPGSAVYGADAFAGVINIITFDAEDLSRDEFGAGTGSFGSHSAWFKVATQWNDWDVGFSLEWDKSDGDRGRRVDNDLQTLFDSIFSTNASLAPGAVSSQYDTLNGQLQFSRNHWKININSWRQADGGIGTGVADALDSTGNQETEQHLVDVNYRNEDLSPNWQIESSFNYFSLKQDYYYNIFPAGTVLPIGSDGNLNFISPVGLVSFPDGYIGSPGGEDRTLAMEFTAFYIGANKHNFRFSAGYKDQEIETHEQKNFGPGVIDGTQPVVNGALTSVTGTPFVFMRNHTREISYFSLQDEWSFIKDWELTAGVRYDDYSDFGNTVNPRLALVWQTNYNLTSKLLYGRAFRAPSFQELFAINNPVVLGNPNLDPETIDIVELSFDYRPLHNLRAQFNLFNYNIDGLIDFIPDGGSSGSSTAQNAFDQEGHGLELELDWDISNTMSLRSSYSWQKAKNSDTGTEVADAPQQLAYAEFRWQFISNWYFSTQLHHVADRPRAMGDPRGTVDNYNLVNMNIYTQQLLRHWDINLAIHNLFDEEAFEPGAASIPIDHPLEGRSVTLNFKYLMGQ